MSCEQRVRKWWSFGFKVRCGGTYLTKMHYESQLKEFSYAGICWRCWHYLPVLAPNTKVVPDVHTSSQSA